LNQLREIELRNEKELENLLQSLYIDFPAFLLVEFTTTIYATLDEKNQRMRLLATLNLDDSEDAQYIIKTYLKSNIKDKKNPSIQLFVIRKSFLQTMKQEEIDDVFNKLTLIKYLVDQIRVIKQIKKIEDAIHGPMLVAKLSPNFERINLVI
jgi:hypothetical protein